ncbi:MAG: chorismate synthase, partial [Clostridiales bacterium]|nr:chorismate synthase [Clostridiales bacterium]
MGSVIGKYFKVSTWGESHGKAVGVVVDGCPAGLMLSEADIQPMLDRRRPGSTEYGTKRGEPDKVEILSGVFGGLTTGAPISMVVYNKDNRAKDYDDIKNIYRPGHADYTFETKYSVRDYRGGGRSSGRETVSRVAAGAIAKKIIEELGIKIMAYTFSINEIEIDRRNIDFDEINQVNMPDKEAAIGAMELLGEAIKNNDSLGGVVECVIKNLPAGIGEPVFDKLDANLAKAMFSIGGVKGFEVGRGFEAAKISGSENNDSFYYDENKKLKKSSNNSGGV